MNNKLLTTWKIIKMLGPIIMLNKISRLPLTANIVKAKLHRLTTHTHMSTTKPTSRDASARRALWRAPAWSVVRGGRRERSAHLFIRAIPASLPKKSAPGTAFFIWKLFWKNTVKTKRGWLHQCVCFSPFPLNIQSDPYDITLNCFKITTVLSLLTPCGIATGRKVHPWEHLFNPHEYLLRRDWHQKPENFREKDQSSIWIFLKTISLFHSSLPFC